MSDKVSEPRNSDIKYDAEKLAKDAQDFLDSFRAKVQVVIDDCMGKAYVDVLPYIETDAWMNYRESLRLELEHEYKFSNFKKDWAINFRRAVFVENREEISKLIEQDILDRIKHLEDCRQEYDQFRYSPGGDTYRDVCSERDALKADRDNLRKALEWIADGGCTDVECWDKSREALEKSKGEV